MGGDVLIAGASSHIISGGVGVVTLALTTTMTLAGKVMGRGGGGAS